MFQNLWDSKVITKLALQEQLYLSLSIERQVRRLLLSVIRIKFVRKDTKSPVQIILTMNYFKREK